MSIEQTSAMPTTGLAAFRVEQWDETPYGEAVGAPALSRATVTISYSGVIEGEGRIEYLMLALPDGSSRFVSQERIIGRVAGRVGSCVLQGHGAFAANVARGEWTIVPGSGTDELRGLRGEGSFRTDEGGAAVTFRYTIDERESSSASV
ncbi:MAG TPA: DUF3224 domain-containing protein [Gemmatimonadales bacterium]|nr:DUF3224 domain-containing protein [Gemmatimonadales bacterium]